MLGVFYFMLFSSMAWVRINLLKPAIYVFPEHIRNIAMIDRTLPLDSTTNKIEEMITGEFFRQDDQAVRRIMEGMADACAGFNLYNLERTSERYTGEESQSVFPSPLSWDEIIRLCEKYQADAILSVELFDSDFLVTNPVQVFKQITEGAIVAGGELYVNGIATIRFGLRVYDPHNKKIIDEYEISNRLDIDAGGYTIDDMVNQVMNKVEAINQASYYAGREYGERITPSYYTVTREFYNKPKRSDDLRMGVRQSEVADWKGAIESWTRALSEKRKIAGRSAFNIAVGYEVLGDLDKAKEWAAKSYTEYREKMGNDYYNSLVYRQREEAVIKRQIPQGE